MCSQKMRTGDDACDARPRLISSRTMRPGDGMKHCLVWKQEPSEFNSTRRKTLGIPASSLQASQRIHAYQPGGRVPKTSTLNEFRFLHLNDFSPCVCVLILIDSTCYNYRGMIRMLSLRDMFWENNPTIRSHGNPLRIRLNGHRTGHPNGLGGFQDAAETPPGAVGRTVVSHLPAISKEP